MKNLLNAKSIELYVYVHNSPANNLPGGFYFMLIHKKAPLDFSGTPA